MQKLRLLSSFIALSLSLAAFADDPQAAPDPAPQAGAYLGVQGGLANQSGQNPVFTTASSHLTQGYSSALNNGFDLGLHAGYRYNDFRLEGEFAHLQNNIADISGQNWNTNLIMFNGYYDFDIEAPWGPYLGAGLGLAIFPSNIANYSVQPSDCEFAYQGIMGLQYHVSSTFALFTDYTYIGYTNMKGNHSNVFNVGMNYFF